MDYTSRPSLRHMALVVIAVSMWNEKNTLTFIFNYYLCYGYQDYYLNIRDKEWQKMEDEVSKKTEHLQLPAILKKYVMGYVRPIGLQILKWIQVCFESGIKVERYLVNEMCWTSNGTVDAKKTAACLIKNENLDICKRYELACVYCLENDIPELWNKIPIIRSKGYYSKYVRVLIPNKLALLWAYDMKGELARLARPMATNWNCLRTGHNPSPYQFAFEYAGVRGNRAGTEYFLQKMTPRERKVSLVEVAEGAVYRMHSDVFCFLLSQMDEEQLMEVDEHFYQEALECLLEWPSQNVFMEMASKVWNFTSIESYEYVLFIISEKVRAGYKDYDYETLFENLFHIKDLNNAALLLRL